jgi:hypothetical protein
LIRRRNGFNIAVMGQIRVGIGGWVFAPWRSEEYRAPKQWNCLFYNALAT